jgi:hypothetical protein
MRMGLFLMIVFCAATLLVRAQEDSDSAVRIIVLEKAWNQAYKAGDIQALRQRDRANQRRRFHPEQSRIFRQRKGHQQQFPGTADLAGIE